MIPAEKMEAVTRGLREAFGVTEFEDISAVHGGRTTSLVFRIILRGLPYLLKVIMRTDDATRHYASMKAGADAGVSPRVWYANPEDRISITDFVATQPLSIAEGRVRLPLLLRTLHALPTFGKGPFNTTCTFLVNTGPMLDGFLEKMRGTNILPAATGEEFFSRYAELAAVYLCDDSEMASSHNDLFKPDNILYDGQRIVLVDWETAFLNDRYADLAAVGNQVVTSEAEEIAYLQAYFGTTPDEYQRARFHLMQQLTHVFYTMAFLLMHGTGERIDWSERVPDLGECYRLMWAGQFDLAEKSVKLAFGRVHLKQLLSNVRQPRYRDSLRVVSERHG